MTQKEVDVVFEITSTIFQRPWFKEKVRTLEEVQWFTRNVLAQEAQIYTLPMGSSWAVIVDKKSFEEFNSALKP